MCSDVAASDALWSLEGMVIRTSEGRWAVCPLSLAAGILAALMWITLLNKCSELLKRHKPPNPVMFMWEITFHFCLLIMCRYLSHLTTSKADLGSTRTPQSCTLMVLQMKPSSQTTRDLLQIAFSKCHEIINAPLPPPFSPFLTWSSKITLDLGGYSCRKLSCFEGPFGSGSGVFDHVTRLSLTDGVLSWN